ncbi:P-loop containing nucleoside triphosphate hydrolase protein [Naematelia encephala]|uniref:p-loop containing nucleoside triphosphate hydrolase protein n=1 Tax=Naematelia encephala TaxID=71784 RepID=A0A1Y2B7J5_9TREE|nr:P-loop containing nucleoside triphosphate hydrolase protein [Naematelia encephala]
MRTRDVRYVIHLARCHCRPHLHIRSASTAPSEGQSSSLKSPRELYAHLEQYVVGQEQTKRILSVAVYNHYQRLRSRQISAEPPIPPPLPTTPPPQTTAPRTAAETTRHPATRPSWDTEALEAPDPSIPASKLDDPPGGDATRVVGVGVGEGDPTLVQEVNSSGRDREGEWFISKDYFISAVPFVSKGSPASSQKQSSEKRKGANAGESPRAREAKAGKQALGYDEPETVRPARAAVEAEEESGDTRRSMSNVEVEKSNVLMIGPTGTGKTLMTKTLAKMLDVPFASCDATTYTSAGYVGDDVENCILRLLQAADYDVGRAEFGIIHIDEIDKLARRGASDGLSTWGGGRDVGGEGVQQAFLRLLEGTRVTLTAKPPPATSAPMMSGLGAAGPGKGGADGLEWDPNNPMNRNFGQKRGVRDGLPGFGGGASGGKGETFLVDTSNILFICSGAFVGLDQLVNSRLGKGSIGFGAPLPISPSSKSPSTSTLPLKSLATTDLHNYGLIPEFVGRLPILTTLHQLSIQDLVRILTEPRNALIKQYTALFDSYGCELRFTLKSLEAVAKKGNERGGGARGLRGVLEQVLGEGMFEIPASSVRYCLITERVVNGQEPALYFSRGQKFVFERAAEEEDGVGAVDLESEIVDGYEDGDDGRVRASG